MIGLPEAGREERLDGLGDVGQARTGHRLDRHLGLADEALAAAPPIKQWRFNPLNTL